MRRAPERGARCPPYPAIAGAEPDTDEVINEIPARDERVVVTKDTDFYHSHLLHQKPWKLLLIHTGNIRTRDLKTLFEQHLPTILTALERNTLVELDRKSVRIVV